MSYTTFPGQWNETDSSCRSYQPIENSCIPFTNSSVGGNSALEGCQAIAGTTIFFPVVMFVAGVLGNILALVVLYRSRLDKRTTKFYSFVIGLAWTDLLGIVMTSPSTIASYVNDRQWVGGEPHCRFHRFAMISFGLATPLILCAMSVERLLSLKCIFFYTSRCKSTNTVKWVILIIWLGVIMFALLPLFGFGKFKLQYSETWCFLDFHSSTPTSNAYAIIYASFNLLAILIMTLCNISVILAMIEARLLRRNLQTQTNIIVRERRASGQFCRTVRKKQKVMEVQMIILMGTVTTVFIVCWAPLMIQIITTIATQRTNYVMDLTAVRMASLNQTLDPWLYILLRRTFLRKVKKTFCKVICKSTKKKERNKSHHERREPMRKAARFSARRVRLSHVSIPRIKINTPQYNADDSLPSVHGPPHTLSPDRLYVGNGVGYISPGTDSALPDIMSSGTHSYVNVRTLPDIAETSPSLDSRYICRSEVNNRTDSKFEVFEKSIKFVFAQKVNEKTISTRRDSEGESTTLSFSSSRCPSNIFERTSADCGNQTTITSGYFTKQSSSMPSIPCSSAEPERFRKATQVHQELRRSKSHT